MSDVPILAIRHGPTEWNAIKKIQGHRDEPLSVAGRQSVSRRRLPARFSHFQWISSPLRRCIETAELLGGTALVVEPLIKEMDWAEWEGFSLAQLRELDAEGMAVNEAAGLDFRPRGGESPREVRTRLHRWVRTLNDESGVVMVAHKGVIRALLSLATGWDMTNKSPIKLRWECAHLFVFDGETVRLEEPNIDFVEDA